ncbi:condensin complex subunit 2-like [Saccostrea echinata]|uniref:condensin complex subunit 2-like n=1 Tax=Saccostrea echinata TaxID=191078 RepID=UPI002A809B31|nr:condensin complex subunit 2-like [Saccostrea echinata]XP_061194278.1 condensin complex subunit 2-like [Saccostrea echinata]
MPSAREVLSPLTTTPNILNSVSNIISPASSRHVSLKSPVPMLTAEHDDAAEKRERRRSRIIQLQQRVGSPASPGERRRSLPLSGLSATQLADHYSSCIKLSAENKINAKNAFGLHLIDYMSDLVKKKELDNFQVASTTLDASAKIYAGRVDAIHSETYKVLTGLGRSGEKSKADEDGEEAMEEDGVPGEEQPEEIKKKKRTKKNNTIESNLKNINVSKMDLEFEVDPLFKVMSAAFDEGGSSGLLLNNLRTFDDQQDLILDSTSAIVQLDHSEGLSQKKPVDMSEIKGMFRGIDLNSKEVCPSFSSFEFTNWDSSMETSVGPSGSTTHAFDLNAETEPIEEVDQTMADLPADMDDMAVEGAFGEDNAEDDGDSGGNNQITEKSICIGDGKAAELMQSAIRDLTHGTTGTLLSVLASEPSDYSYFNKALLRAWAGPAHWRIGPLSKDPRTKSQMEKTQKTKKSLLDIDYDEVMEEKDFAKYFKSSKSITLTKSTLTKYSKEKNTLPKDLHYDADKLFRLFCKSQIMIKRQDTASEDIDEEIENYNYENPNDKENYCPKGDEEVDDDDDVGGGFDFTAGEGNFSQDDYTMQPDSTLNNTTLMGDKLVSQPNKVEKIDINYAKTAKKLDVKKLKGVIWHLLTKKSKKEDKNNHKESTEEGMEESGEKPTENGPGSSENSNGSTDMNGSLSFQELLNDLPQNVSSHMAKNLSVPIAFVCLLHLANEKTLKIESDNMSDLKITQGI